MIEEGDARFSCTFEPHSTVPLWKIDGLSYVWTSLPERHSIDPVGLTVRNVRSSMNGTTYQCIVPGVAESSVGILFVISNFTHLISRASTYQQFTSSTGTVQQTGHAVLRTVPSVFPTHSVMSSESAKTLMVTTTVVHTPDTAGNSLSGIILINI